MRSAIKKVQDWTSSINYVFFLFRHITNPSGAIHQNGLPDMSNHQQALRDSIFGGTGTDLSRLQWPRNSIPRRVKKLSWEDESYDLGYDRDISTFTDPDVSVTPLELQLEPSQVGRAIYFWIQRIKRIGFFDKYTAHGKNC